MLNILFSITLTFIIFFSPFAFGTVHPGPITALQCSILFLFFLYILKSIKEGVIQYRKNVLNIFFLLFIVYVWLQLCLNITREPYRTFLGLKMGLVYFALFLVITNKIQKMREIESIIFKITLAGLFVSLLGISQKLLGADKIFWTRTIGHSNFFGPFINENHFASYISVVGLVTLGNIFANIYGRLKIPENLRLKQKLLIISETVLNKKVCFSIFSFIIMIIGLFLSKSRSGISFFSIAVLFFILSTLFRKNAKKAVWFMLFGLLAIWLLLNWINVDKELEELQTIIYSSEYTGRVTVYEEAKNMLADYPLHGVGIGAFSNIFPMYRTGCEIYFYKHLHNDIFQFLIELGIVGFIIILLPFAVFLLRLFSVIGKTRSTYKYYSSLGILASFFYLGLHSMTDFSMRINAVSSVFVILSSLVLLITYFKPSKTHSEIEMGIRRVATIKSGKAKSTLYILAALFFVYLSFGLSRPFLAYIIAKNRDSASSFRKAISLDSKKPDLYYKYYRFILEEWGKGKINKDIAYNNARHAIDKAIKLNPYKTSYIIGKGWLEFKWKNYEKANLLFKEAALAEPNNHRVQLAYAYILFRQGLREKDKKKRDLLLKRGLIYYETAGFLSKYTSLSSIIKDKTSYESLKQGLKKEGITVK